MKKIMDKFNNLSKVKKAGVIVGILALLMVVGITIGSIMGNQVKDVVLSKDNLTGLIEKNYTIETINQSKDEKVLEVTIKGVLSESDLESFAKNLNEKNNVSGWGKEKIIVNIFNDSSETIQKDDFYVEGLLNRIVLNTEKSIADISSYVNVPSVNKTDVLVDYSKGEIESNDGNLILSLDMDVTKDKDKLAEVLQQAKTFSILFRETNSDKDIKSIELRINPNDEKIKYNFHTEYENILEVIDVLPL